MEELALDTGRGGTHRRMETGVNTDYRMRID